jgi:hypothetical protein
LRPDGAHGREHLLDWAGGDDVEGFGGLEAAGQHGIAGRALSEAALDQQVPDLEPAARDADRLGAEIDGPRLSRRGQAPPDRAFGYGGRAPPLPLCH